MMKNHILAPMTTIQVRSAEADLDVSVQVCPGELLLIGRRPEPGRLDWDTLRPLVTQQGVILETGKDTVPKVRTLTVQSSRASANHILVLVQKDKTLLIDVESLNGSWLRLAPGVPCAAPSGGDVTIMISSFSADSVLRSTPPDAKWSQTADYGTEIKQALTGWLRSNKTAVEVVLHPAGAEGSPGFPLADGQTLEICPVGTLQISSSELADKVRRYVYDQNARYWQLERRVAGMVVESPVMRKLLLRTAEAAAAGRRAVLLGPTGVGKELLARSYHGYSARHDGPFVTVNCALLDKQLLYAQLFGARRGSFTGAVSDVTGLIESADGGTLFLDELAEMTLEVQAALLRFLDTRGEYCRLGDTRSRRVTVQVVCATNAPLDDPSYRTGRFRNDLWYRLASAVLLVPPLRERREDILAFLRSRIQSKNKRSVAECLSPEALQLVLDDEWPGNFRDLENFIDRLPPSADPGSLSAERCRQLLREGRADTMPMDEPRAPAKPLARSESTRNMAYLMFRDEQMQSNRQLDWRQLFDEALAAFLADHGEEAAGWQQLHCFINQYLKPSYIGHSAELLETQTPGLSDNYSALARVLHVADGKTVKTHLSRFEERFVRATPAKQDGERIQ